MVLAVSALILCLLAVLAGNVLGWLGGQSLDLSSILGAFVLVGGGLAVGLGAAVFDAAGDEVEVQGSGR